ncbi:phosphoribosyltransferase [Cumulibacter manganitolerans]|uniref:phosphoribosyltransferase n=1 Tax=Cumulibacter manganitolerans TaxID=1884992 RepID=UPI001E63DE70|nr:phosphoribosyltransferase family protein [Cumulibacter manganitolerans]
MARDEYVDRVDAGRRLAERLRSLRGQHVVVLGLPRGGVPVAFEVARSLGAPLDVIVVRKLGLPTHPELAMGAIGEGGYRVVDRELMARAGVRDAELAQVEARERAALDSRIERYRHGRSRADLRGATAVIVDDGIATGRTVEVACAAARRLGAARVVVAVPVGPVEALEGLPGADEVVVARTPDPFLAVGRHYRDFDQTTDDEVVRLLDAAAEIGADERGRPR